MAIGDVVAGAYHLPDVLSAAAPLNHHLADGRESAPVVLAVEARPIGLVQPHPAVGLGCPLLARERPLADPDVDQLGRDAELLGRQPDREQPVTALRSPELIHVW